MTAEVNGELELFLQWYVASGQKPNITRLAHAGLHTIVKAVLDVCVTV